MTPPPPLPAPAREENVPRGDVRDWHDDPKERQCGRCGANLARERHRKDCPERVRELFLVRSSCDPRFARAEQELERVTLTAFNAWLQNGGRP